ncbi:LysE/ArgO family amino acid transporter [Paenibacillus sp. P96]|uniref:LysE/ArgO family amino acid transporter n=1 Tax=Paenibacillus zeirhizosphaerae TaxID=2987519 RepID=A0ABT9FN08_9BACL|nr:LysE/ArgO family amino acid transporter [Paenibacillus sp. P96]MDP4096121.1 LysE/ArgO family amino acid transporter [Paenibacillus sp. P96]
MMEAAVHAFLLALGLILPLGVQNVFIFNQGASQPSLRKALPAVITAGVCDTLLIFLAVGGVSLLMLRWSWLTDILYGAGCLFLLYMAWSIWRSGQSQAGAPSPLRASRQVAFAASVSLLNPHAILDTVGVIGTSSLQYEGGDRWVFTLTAALVSWCWFAGLAAAGRGVGRIDPAGGISRNLNRVSALVIFGLAIYMAVTLLR